MCPIPALGIAPPWDAPLEWVGFLLFTLLSAWVTVGRRFLPDWWHRRTELVPPPGHVLLAVAALCGVVLEVLLLLVFLPAELASGPVVSSGDAQSMSATCLETIREARSSQLWQVLIVVGALLLIWMLLIAIQQWRFPPRRSPTARPSASPSSSD